jgi:hypothetical protein
MKIHIARLVAAFWLLLLSLTSLTLAQTPNATAAPSGTAEAGSPSVATDVTTTGGTADYLPIFSGANTIIDSAVFQTGSGTAAHVGINTAAPATRLDVNGNTTIRGTLTFPALGTATATAGDVSQGLNFVASSYNSTGATAVSQTFRLQAESAANDTTAPSGTLNLLYALGTAAPTETGLKVSSKGLITFAPGQTFPGGGAFCIATAGGFGSGGTTFVEPGFTVPGENKCTQWSGFTKTASTVILNTSGAACLSSTGKTLTVSVSSADPDYLGTTPAADYILLTRTSSTGSFTGGSDQGQFSGSADQVTCTSSVLSLPDTHD